MPRSIQASRAIRKRGATYTMFRSSIRSDHVDANVATSRTSQAESGIAAARKTRRGRSRERPMAASRSSAAKGAIPR
jgi:hypothetical protein